MRAPRPLALGARDLLDRAQLLEVSRRGVREHADRRLGHRGEIPDLAPRARAHLDHERLVIRAEARQRERDADVVVQVPDVLVHAPRGGEHGGDHLLRRRLPVRARDSPRPGCPRDHGTSAQRLHRAERIVDADHGFPVRPASGGTGRSRPIRLPAAAPWRAEATKSWPSARVPGSGTKRSPRFEGAAVDGAAGEPDPGIGRPRGEAKRACRPRRGGPPLSVSRPWAAAVTRKIPAPGARRARPCGRRRESSPWPGSGRSRVPYPR